jgi:hypothetical protein
MLLLLSTGADSCPSVKNNTISSGDILRVGFSWSDLIRNSVESLDIPIGKIDFILIALICLLRSFSVFALQGVCPVNI